MKDTYHMIAEETYGFFKDRGSKFEAYTYPVFTEKDWQDRLEEVKKIHPKARHHCYAYRLGMGNLEFRANDDGEPSGTAGKPILGQLDSFGVTNTLVVVVRYFGGTLLGASGLINAYRTAAAAALEKAEIIEKTIEDIYRLTFDYALMSNVMNAIKKEELEMVSQDFQEIGKVDVAIRKSEVAPTLERLQATIAEVYLQEVAELEEIEGLDIDFLYTR
ncbi:MAG TPA: YigZ family protein [Saprospiraceae bacterium]|nr:YigZ family protein [Saprospiraceae bacterium]